MNETPRGHIARASALVTDLVSPPLVVPGFYPGNIQVDDPELTYHDVIRLCRKFYETDPIASTVINRMADMAITKLRHRDRGIPKAVRAYYTSVAEHVHAFLKVAALEYLLHGMALPDYTTTQVIGNRIDPAFGRKKLIVPGELWNRNPEHVVLRKRPIGVSRAVYLRVPPEEQAFIQSKGKRSDGTDDSAAYAELARDYPEYVRAVQKGVTLFPLASVRPVFRKLASYGDYPRPFLRPALRALQHKEYLKQMDRAIAARAIEAMRHVTVGSDQFPADDEDITATKNAMTQAATTGDRVFNFFTNHTVAIKWIFPPLDVLMNEAKYVEPNADIFYALGFPRILAVGETAKSNASDSKIAFLGPVSTLNDMRDALLAWVDGFYKELAELNGFEDYPEPYLTPIAVQDITALTQFAIEAVKLGAISKDTIAQLYGTTYAEEQEKIKREEPIPGTETTPPDNSPNTAPSNEPNGRNDPSVPDTNNVQQNGAD